MARLLALDVGDKRIGVALSDPLEMLASPHSVLERSGDTKDVAELAQLAARQQVRALVVGMPHRTDGKPSAQAERVKQFADKLQHATGLPVIEVDERFTTKQAQRALLAGDVSRAGRKQRVDKVAAALILQHYLDSKG